MSTLGVVVGFLGPLCGVALGGFIAFRSQAHAWARETRERRRAEKREACLRFMMAARTWQANVLRPGATVHGPTVYGGHRYADAGDAYGEAIRALVEIRLLGGGDDLVEAARAWEAALRELGKIRARPPAGDATGAGAVDPALTAAVEECHRREEAFTAVARGELALDVP